MLGWSYNQGLVTPGSEGQACIELDNMVSPTHSNHVERPAQEGHRSTRSTRSSL